MKKIIPFIFMILFCACSENEYSVEEKLSEKMNSATSDIILVAEMPDWLQIKIHDIEKIPLVEAKAYQCEWKNQTVYFIYNNFNSCLMCDAYHTDGNKIIFKDDGESDDFTSTSKNWKLIWSFCDCNWKNS
ncbi:MAG: hypothetical protein Q7W54_14530 [Bacteroidota bacterium]|nr:hypothetical protein [Bacteroidota bacterium]